MKAMKTRGSVERGEIRLVRVGHALWAMMKRDRAKNGGRLPQSEPIYEALETVWRLKREYRAELAASRQAEGARLRNKFAAVERAA